MSGTMPTRYNYSETETRIYGLWEKNRCFEPSDNPGAKPFSMVIPPPNVTGRLHMGHALNNTIQDMLIRYKRMDGYSALWVPGTDHAGIATQTVVKKMLDAEGIDYRSLGREAFVTKVWDWKQKYGSIIIDQLKRIGAGCDWSRQRFTMDEGLSRAVNHAFKKLYDSGLIYRGERIVNWCPVDRTALSDDEVETQPDGEKGFLWHIRYPFIGQSGFITVATTRPETMFGDTAVAVHPEDPRYTHLIGKTVMLPVMEKPIPVIGDTYVDREFGTGCLKITPAHDPNDYETGLRHNLPCINIMHEDARMNDNVPERHRGLSREKCREKIIIELKERGLLEKEESRMTPVARSYRSKAAIEYRLSKQWFIKMKPMVEKTLALGHTCTIHPEKWQKVYLQWMTDIRDWCISRQIWWGHRIPAWHHLESGRILVAETVPDEVRAHPGEWQQETDVLDTWFSSALWPMSTMGWPDTSDDFKKFFPTSALSTAKDIIFFWVARMNVMSAWFTGKLPYRDVYIHPTVMDDNGETMSKSKGNGIDPLHIINGATKEELTLPVRDARPARMQQMIAAVEKKYPDGFTGVGADALRYTLLYLCSSGQELKLSMDSFTELGRRFITKFWNSARFIHMHLSAYTPQNKENKAECGGEKQNEYPSDQSFPEDIWMYARLAETAHAVRKALDAFDFANLGSIYYQFVWNDFCDWYIELTKNRLTGSGQPSGGKTDSTKTGNVSFQNTTTAALTHIVTVFRGILSLLHPLIPFITEEIWQSLIPLAEEKGIFPAGESAVFCIQSKFPHTRTITAKEKAILDEFEILQSFTAAIRTLRTQYKIHDKVMLDAVLVSSADVVKKAAENFSTSARALAGVKTLTISTEAPAGMVSVMRPDFAVFFDIRQSVDPIKETARLQKEIEQVQKDIAVLSRKLSNQGFLANAKAELVSAEQERLSKYHALEEKLRMEIKNFT